MNVFFSVHEIKTVLKYYLLHLNLTESKTHCYSIFFKIPGKIIVLTPEFYSYALNVGRNGRDI